MGVMRLLGGFGAACLLLTMLRCGDDSAQQQITCDGIFGQISGYMSCEVKPLSCTFYWRSDQTDDQGELVERPCDQICLLGGAPCIDAWEEQMDGSCEKQKNPDPPNQELPWT